MALSSKVIPKLGYEKSEVDWRLRAGLVLSVTALQLGTFYLTYKLYALIPYNVYLNVQTAWDNYIPYLWWSWTVYYFGFAYVIVAGAAGIWRMSKLAMSRTVAVYSILILIGALLHVAIPTRAPWPDVNDLTAIQCGFKTACHIEPLACLPSMHVTLVTLTAFVSFHTLRTRIYRLMSIVIALTISASVLTAKEHWFLDAITGLLLGLAAGWGWKEYVRRPPLERRTFPGSTGTSYNG